MAEIIRRVRGNPKALARLVAFILCLCLAAVTGSIAGVQWSAAVGAFLGAAVSLAVNWIVLTLEEVPDDTPSALLKAAHDDIELAGYYRRKQIITLRVAHDGELGDTIVLHFSSRLDLVRSPVPIEHQIIRAPKGTTYIASSYTVGGKRVAPGGRIEIKEPTSDELLVKYRIEPNAEFPIEDAHYWASPVLDYVVRVGHSEKFSFEVGTIRPAGEMLPLNPVESGSPDFLEFEGRGPAFSTQGLRLKLARNTIPIARSPAVAR